MPPSTNQPSPEKRLLVACARTRLAPAALAAIQQSAQASIDFELLLRFASEHSVLPLLALNLPAAAPGAFSDAQIERLRRAARASGIRSLQLSAELIRVMDVFRANNIPAFPYKGPVLAAQAYGDLALREFEDLDILLSQRDILRAKDVLLRLEYQPRYPWLFSQEADAALVPGEYNFFNAAREVIVELHTERTLRHFPVAPDFDELAKNLVAVSLSGHEIRTFCPEDMLVLLCVHGSKDFWERISWVADIAEFTQAETTLDWDRALERARSFGAQRMLFLGLRLASRLLDTPLPPKIASLVAADSTAFACATKIEQRILAPAASAARPSSFTYRRQMVPGTLAGWRYAFRLASQPAEEDWLMVRLPRALTPLYLVLRPLRVLRKERAAKTP